MTLFFISFVGGFIIGIISSILAWPRWLAFLAAITWGIFSYAVTANADVVAQLKANTVHLANGSGFVLKAGSGRTYLVTNYHVCLQGSWQGVLTGSLESGEVLRGKIVKTSIGPDLCAARIERRPAPLILAQTLSKGEEIYTRGYPYGVLSQSHGRYVGVMTWSYIFPIAEIGQCPKESLPVLSGPGTIEGCSVDYTDNLTNLYARPGSSGSPVVNTVGELVGVMSSWYGGQDSGGMVKLEDVKEFFKGL